MHRNDLFGLAGIAWVHVEKELIWAAWQSLRWFLLERFLTVIHPKGATLMDQQIANFLASKVESDPAKAAQLSALILAAFDYGKVKLADLASKLAPTHPKIAVAIAEALKFA